MQREQTQVKQYLLKQDVFTLHANAARHFPRNRILVSGIDKQFQADLVDMTAYATQNDSVRYLLTCINVFSKYAWVRCLKDKSGTSVTKLSREC
ncbi:hypothetical protein EXN66_Car013921 [Channa argus]|uniref:Integrase catalytic domain-containing protein n=1 Tax=Channa argus TaxID=215402 RepID=A0A6G1Q6H7_CHAAH|nr:hypothetical protein EXN66_Car013921 [Channa argus]